MLSATATSANIASLLPASQASALPAGQNAGTTGQQGSNGTGKGSDTGKASGLSQDAKTQSAVEQLQSTDRKVHQHELAHLAASGGLATSGASYSFKTGPDGKRYAVAGEVHIDVSPGNTPEETIRKARIVQAAALAPADPSGQDRAVAAQAAAMEAQASVELSQRSKGQNQLARTYGNSDLPRSSFAAAA
ncbi:SprA-related family protein [Andreprevotia lacus DSM 23236]|jgi:hypothetical protein|uniref:SprA-related family protein n=1 Tax=Andreprevotia lacus DSM 23236 TaxID=1121001 RepID=A0A1W1WW96_9NEIS|nr:putative metalloprotease CJM1_0395 family protein [Andreprevotia lacus]SMC16006.1 SprA-related family protein [Andreprevotia lacus DSM 23236]